MSAPDPRRHGRQIRLADIGAEGQARLCASSVVLRSDGLTRAVEERYVRSSGIDIVDAAPTVDPARIDHDADASALGMRHAPAREVAEGALRALAAFRAALQPTIRGPRSAGNC